MILHGNLSFDLLENRIASAADTSEENEDRKRLLRTLGKAAEGELTPRQKECVRHYYGEGKTEQEIAELLGVQRPAVCKHLKKARERLRRVLSYSLPG